MPISIETVASAEQIGRTAALARSIWQEHYTPLIGAGQVEYMLGRFQSAEAITEQIREGYLYYILRYDGQDAGYLAALVRAEELFLSKLYVDKRFRALGIARRALDFLVELCRSESLAKIALTVNRGNAGSIIAYRKMGFAIAREQVADIGNGFVMDDYVMEKAIEPSERE